MKYEWHLCGSANQKFVGVILEEAIIRRGDKSQRHRGEGGSQLRLPSSRLCEALTPDWHEYCRRHVQLASTSVRQQPLL